MMKRGRSAVKSSEPSQVDVQRVLRFKLPNSAIEEEGPHDDVQGNEDASTKDVSSKHGERPFDVLLVNNDSIFNTEVSSFNL